jgi:MscS family membrane protein
MEEDPLSFLEQTFYGNTIAQWGLTLLIILGAFVVGKVLYWFTTNVVRRFTARTKTNLDDLIIDMIEEPIVFAVTVAGIWYGMRQLTLPEMADGWIDQGLQFLIVLIITWLIARLLDALYREYLVPLAEKSETDLDDQLLPIVSRGTKLAVWSLGIIVALNNAGYNIGALLAGLGIGGLALAMAAKDTVSNVFGGITIFTDQPFVINERVKVEGFDGVVKEIGMRSTRLETREGRLVTIPNSTFADRPVENVSREPSRRVVLDLGLTYDTSPGQMRQALAIVEQIIEESPDLENKRTVSFNNFGDFALNIHVRYYIRKGADIWPTKSEVSLAIMERFAAAGLEMAFPTQTLYTRSLDTAPE